MRLYARMIYGGWFITLAARCTLADTNVQCDRVPCTAASAECDER